MRSPLKFEREATFVPEKIAALPPEGGESSERRYTLADASDKLDRSMPQNARITIPQIAQRLNVGRMMVYEMLERGVIPGIRVGRRWVVTRYAYQQWERNCGTRFSTPERPTG